MAKDGKVTQDEMNRLLAGITDSRPIDPDFDRNASKEEKQALKNIEERELRLVNEFAELTKDITALQAYTKDFKGLLDQNATVSQNNEFQGEIIPYDKTGGFKDGSSMYPYVENFMDNPAMDKYLDRVLGQLKMTVGTDAMTSVEWTEIMEAMESRMYDYDSDNTINQMLEGVAKWGKELTEGKLQTKLDNNSKVVTDQTIATENVESVTADNVISLDSNLTVTEANTNATIELSKTIKRQEVKVAKEKSAYDKTVDQVVTDPVLNLILKNPSLLKMIFAKGGVLSNKTYAGGGITYGPSHAQGGIPTRYGELEGGEAVINKRSTSMFAGELSRINQAGGGVSFADGGVTREFAKGGMVDPAKSPTVQQYNHDVMGLWTDSIPAFWVLDKDVGGMDVTPDRENRVRGTGNFQQTPLALNTMEHYEAMFGVPKYGKLGNFIPGRSDKYANMDFTKRDTKVFAAAKKKLNDAKKGGGMFSSIPDFMQNMDENPSRFGRTSIDMRDATNPIAEATANAQQMGAEWVGTFLALSLGATSGVIPQLLRLGYQGARTGFSANYGALSGGGNQLLTGTNFLQKLIGGMRMTGGASGMYGMGTGANNIATGKGSTKDLANVFMAGHGDTLEWLKAFTKAGYYMDKGSYGSALMQFLPKTLGTTLGFTEKMAGMFYDSGKGIIGLPDMIGGAKEGYALLKNWFTGGSEDAGLLGETGFEIDSVKPNSLAGGGVLPHSPITKVNDMILTKDGQMIETHADDNIIAKKGGITQTPAGGGGGESRVEELLKQLIMVTQQGGDVYMDGSKVSAVINQTNYNV